MYQEIRALSRAASFYRRRKYALSITEGQLAVKMFQMMIGR